MDLKTAAHVIETTRAFGGGTFDTNGQALHNLKYVVGGAADELIVDIDDDSLVLKTASFFNHNAPKNVGTWVHMGQIYLDVVDLFDFDQDARKAARERGEIAYYDALDGQEVFV